MSTSNIHGGERELVRYARSNLALRARALLRAIVSDDPHLSYQQIEALAESRVQLTGPLHAHLSSCGTCRAELKDMQAFVASFRVPTERPRGSWLEFIRALFERPLQLGGVAAAVAAICVAVAVVERNESHTGASNVAAARTVVIDDGQHARTSQDCSERALAASSPQWDELYQRGDYKELASAVRQPAASGNPVAQTTLATLLARGLGTERDLNAARMWLQRAARHGDGCAKQMLAALD
jgi:hypothetical protein